MIIFDNRTRSYPAGTYMFKVNNRNPRTKCKICSKLTIKTPERRHWRRIYLTLNIFPTLFSCFYGITTGISSHTQRFANLILLQLWSSQWNIWVSDKHRQWLTYCLHVWNFHCLLIQSSDLTTEGQYTGAETRYTSDTTWQLFRTASYGIRGSLSIFSLKHFRWK